MSGLDDFQSFGNEPPPRVERSERRRPDDEDAEYRLAIEASKAEAEEERKRRAKEAMASEEDEDLAKAIKLSREEEDLRKRELEESNAQSLFDDSFPAQTQPTGYNQGYQQQGAVDWFGNPINPQQPLTTGYLNNQYAQPTGFTNQPTGMPNGYTNGLQGQPTAFDQNPYSQQNNFLQPQATMQPQQTAFNPNNPYGTDMFSQQQPIPQIQQPQPQESLPAAGSHNPWAQNQPADALKPMPTGSNNPFANRSQVQGPATSSGPPTLNTLAEERATTQFPSTSTNPNPIINYQAPPHLQPQLGLAPPKSTPPQFNPHHQHLNALLSSGEGQDTFGNVGDLRIPAQHTAPGTFVNSAGQGLDRLRATHTGNNPFFGQQQTGFAQPANNPWGGGQRPQQGGGSLIDL